jgi:hypothetical protein
MGFPSTISATYGFARWRAYRTASLGDKNQAALEGAVPLTAMEVAITAGAEGGALITIHITGAVTLVPWCEDRPWITQTNPLIFHVPGLKPPPLGDQLLA